jgi:hypothetical protein
VRVPIEHTLNLIDGIRPLPLDAPPPRGVRTNGDDLPRVIRRQRTACRRGRKRTRHVASRTCCGFFEPIIPGGWLGWDGLMMLLELRAFDAFSRELFFAWRPITNSCAELTHSDAAGI